MSPKIAAVSALPGFRLFLTWENGRQSTVDVADIIQGYVVFTPIREAPERFDAATVGEWGWSVHWTDEMELSADMLWQRAAAQAA